MCQSSFPTIEDRWRRERAERARRSVELRQRVIQRGGTLFRAFGVREAWLFGSAAAGMAERESDLDLLVMPVAAEDYWPMRRELEEILGCRLDLYTQDDDPIFVRKIRERPELIYEPRNGS